MFSSAPIHPQQIPDVGKITEGLPGWATVLVVISLTIMAVALAAPKVLPLFKDDKKLPEPSPTPTAATAVAPAATALATAADASNELITRIISRLEDRLDAANTEVRELRETYEARITKMQGQLSAYERDIYELRSRLAEAERNVIAAREDASRLRGQLEQRTRAPEGPPPW